MENKVRGSLFAITFCLIGILTFGGNTALGNSAPYTASNPASSGLAWDWAAYKSIGNGFIGGPSWDGGDPDGDAVTYTGYRKEILQDSDGNCDCSEVSLQEDDVWFTLEGVTSDTAVDEGETRITIADYIYKDRGVYLNDFIDEACTCFCWQIVAGDSEGAEASSPVWSYETRGILIVTPGEDDAVIIGDENTIEWRSCGDSRNNYDSNEDVKILFGRPSTGCTDKPEFVEIATTENNGSLTWITSDNPESENYYPEKDDCKLKIVAQTENGYDANYQGSVFSMINATTDIDEDGVDDSVDNCLGISNTKQEDCDKDGVGDACEAGISGEISVAEDVLWPPNHKYVDVGLDFSNITSSNDGPLTVELTVCSDERQDITSMDIEIDEDGALLLRAERLGSLDGRVYSITAQIKDDAENLHTSTAQVNVPKSKNRDAEKDPGSGYCETATITK